MRRRTFLCLSAVGIVAAPRLGVAQRTVKAPYVGYMSPGDIPRYDNAFLQGLQEQGYILPGEIDRYDDALWKDLVKRGGFDGKRIRIAIRTTIERFPERAPAVAEELVSLNVDCLFTSTPPEAAAAQRAVQRARKAIPIVFGPQIDPVGGGLVASLARPGGNVTGLLLNDPELDAKRLEILLEAVPRMSRVAYLHEPAALPSALSLSTKEAVLAAARTKGVRLHVLEVRRAEDLKDRFAQIIAEQYEGLLVMLSPLLVAARSRLVAFAAKERMPAIYGDTLFVEAGGLMFYGSPYVDL